MGSQTALARNWTARFGSDGGADLDKDLSRLSELQDAVLPVGWSIKPYGDSYLRIDGQTLSCEFRAHLAPPGVAFPADDDRGEDALGLVVFNFDTTVDDDDFACCMELQNLEIPAGIQRRGAGRLVVGGLVQLGHELGLEYAVLHAERVGRYAWARCGFDFLEEDHRRGVVEAASDFADRLGRPVDLDAVQHPWDMANLPGLVTRGEIEDAGGPPAYRGRRSATFTLGQALLLGPALDRNHWHGKLQLSGAVRGNRYLFPNGDATEASTGSTPES